MKVGCSRRQSSWVITTATIVIHQHISIIGKWFLLGIVKTTASAFASTNANNNIIIPQQYSTTSSAAVSSSSSLTTHCHPSRQSNIRGCSNRGQASSYLSQLPFTTWESSRRLRKISSSSSLIQLHQYSSTAEESTDESIQNADDHDTKNTILSSATNPLQFGTKKIVKSTSTTTTPPPQSTTSSSSSFSREQQHHDRRESNTIQRLIPTSTLRISEQSRIRSSSSKDTKIVEPQPEYNITLRLANMNDIASISWCNLQTLPENYNDLYYMNHINDYPYLSFVAVIDNISDETINKKKRNPLHGNYQPNPPNESTNNNNHHMNFIQRQFQQSKRRFATSFWTPSQEQQQYYKNDEQRNTATTTKKKSIVVGYLLGKISPPQEPYHFSLINNNNNKFGLQYNNYNNNPFLRGYGEHVHKNQQQQQYQPYEMIGHVSSLAVLPEARRRGLAQALLEQFHHHLIHYNTNTNGNVIVTSTGLHVRCSNNVAVQLYQKLGYAPTTTIPSYYEDGEDAYYMQKMLVSSNNLNIKEAQKQQKQQHVAENDNFELPRVISVLRENDVNNDTNKEICSSAKEPQQLHIVDSFNRNHCVSKHEEEEEEEEEILMNGTS